MKNRKLLFVFILLLTVGFATVSTSLFLNGKTIISTNKNDFDVYFSGAEIDEFDVSNEVIKDKKHIVYTSNELKALNDTSVLKYEVTNDSTEYDANVTISCTPMKTNYIEVTLNPVTFEIDAGEIKTGEIEAKLTKVSNENQNISIDCKLDVKAISKTAITDNIERNNAYQISGILTDGNGNVLNNKLIAVFSDKQEIITDRNGYFYVSNLEKGIHKIYFDQTATSYSDNQEELEEYLIAKISTNGKMVLINDNYKITSFEYGQELIDNSNYCNYDPGKTWDYPFRQYSEPLTIPCDGTYKLEVWGAQGGHSQWAVGGGGGYANGQINLKKDVVLTITVGGQGGGNNTWAYWGNVASGGWNGGGNSGTDKDGNDNGTNETGGGGGGFTVIKNNGVSYLCGGGGGGGGGWDGQGGTGSAGGGGGGGSYSDPGKSGSGREQCGNVQVGGNAGGPRSAAGVGSGWVNTSYLSNASTASNQRSGSGFARITLVSLD